MMREDTLTKNISDFSQNSNPVNFNEFLKARPFCTHCFSAGGHQVQKCWRSLGEGGDKLVGKVTGDLAIGGAQESEASCLHVCALMRATQR